MTSKNLKKTLLILFITTTNIYSQESNLHQFGLTASFSGAQIDVLVPIRISNHFTLSPGVGVASFGNSNTELHLSLSPKIYLNNKQVKPFIGLRGVLLNSIPKEGTTVTDYLAGILCGGEYFINQQFSIGIETQLNFSISDENSLRFGNPNEVNINSATVIFISIYF